MITLLLVACQSTTQSDPCDSMLDQESMILPAVVHVTSASEMAAEVIDSSGQGTVCDIECEADDYGLSIGPPSLGDTGWAPEFDGPVVVPDEAMLYAYTLDGVEPGSSASCWVVSADADHEVVVVVD